MKENKEKEVKVNPAVLEIIRKAARPMIYRLDTLLESHYTGSIKYSEIDLMALLEYRASAQILDILLEEYEEMELIPGEDKILMPFEHFTLITTTSKTIESSYRAMVGNTPLWTH